MCFPASHTDQRSYSLPMGLHPDDPDGDGEDDYEDEYDDEDNENNEEDYNDELPPFEDCFGTDLAMTFDDVQTAGDIATFARHPALVNPGIRIEGHPVIPLPLTPGDAELLKRTCGQGPCSKGDRTIGDKTWKLAFSQFELVNPAWPDFLDNLACELVDKLGIPGVSAEPRELVLCETGSCFQLDGEFEKERNAIATMVICLPSEHEGGDVHLVFGDDKRTFSTAESSAFEMTTMAWFSDVQHEVAVLESGHRLTLTYDFVPLMMLGSHPKAAFWGQQKETVDNMLNELQEDYPDQNIVVYPLDHLVEGLVTRGDRLLLYEVLFVVFGDEDISRHVNADLVYREIIQRGTPQLLMKREECSLLRMSRLETLGHYATIFDNALTLGLKDDACRFLESCCHDLLSNRPTWPSHERLTSPAAGALLVPAVQSLDKHECPCPPSLKAVFELVLREGVLGDLQPPSKPEGWKRTTIRVCNQWTFPRRCPLCAPLDDFLANKDEEKWTHELNDAERRHVEDVLSSDIMRGHLKFMKERRGPGGTYIVQKTNKQYEDELNFHRGRVSRIKKDLSSLRKPIVSEMLGDEMYQELILLKKPRRTAAAATTGTKRPAEEAADEAGSSRRTRRGRQ
ncbi:hypothetical protein C8035_v008348 [Colletotrichum spinosum]|uniref:Prolyl 4-hydroxylase alpha subunit Fe(2+) 2OG dioxygenase domain-containing protein n=1 Tax=Colletotrichum spinosum TaxID=1347390 RepID=A0A4V3HSP5_9PEZI|nr:hypothetical protein C8035_v008348 [Colletotrichum spinosum]